MVKTKETSLSKVVNPIVLLSMLAMLTTCIVIIYSVIVNRPIDMPNWWVALVSGAFSSVVTYYTTRWQMSKEVETE